MTHRPDTATAKDSGSAFTPHPAGQYAMRCVDIVNLGIRLEQFGDSDPREVEKVALVFASGAEQNGTLALVTVEVTLSMNEKANLRKLLEMWRGKSYSAEEAEAGIPLHKLYGHPALVSIEHITTKRGRRFAKVVALAPLPKAMPAPSKDLLEAYARPAFFEERKLEYAKQVAAHRERSVDPGPDFAPEDDGADAVPF